MAPHELKGHKVVKMLRRPMGALCYVNHIKPSSTELLGQHLAFCGRKPVAAGANTPSSQCRHPAAVEVHTNE